VPKSAKLQKSVVPPDKTLFETGADYLNKGQYIRARLSFQTLISTYPDSDMAAEAIFATADSFYDEGGTENLLQAEDQYKNFIIFYPTSQKAPDAEMKIISLHMKRLRSPENDQEYSTRALQEIQLFQKLFPESDFVPIVKKLEIEVKDRLARQDLVIAKFYGDRGNYVGALGRYQDIREKYKEFTGMDEVLFRMATGFEKALRPEEAAICLTELVKGYPFSKLSEEATMRLEKMGKPIPPVDKVLAAANQANLKPSAPFVPWKFLADFATELGFKGPPDQYVLAKKKPGGGKSESRGDQGRGSQAGKQAGTSRH